MKYVKLILFISIISLINSCKESRYKSLEEREILSGMRYDSLFLGIKFNMSSKEFYDHCWKMNKNQIIIQGPSNNSVKYILKEDSINGIIEMLFYPRFMEDKIYEMNATFSYASWAPWNRHLFSDKLILEIKKTMENWYKSRFISIQDNDSDKELYVTVKGNRRIIISIKDDREVRVRFSDLIAEKKLEK